jgi:hypothetical protein
LKLVISEGQNPAFVVKSWPSESNCSWLAVWWEPTDEDYLRDKKGRIKRSYRGAEKYFGKLVSQLIPYEDSIIYASLNDPINGNDSMIQDLQAKGHHFETHPANPRKTIWNSIFHVTPRSNRDLIFAETNKRFVVDCFDHRGAWESFSWLFLVTRRPISDWVRKLDSISNTRVLTAEILDEIDLFLTNEYEHGFDLVSSRLRFDQLRQIAEEAGNNLGWRNEIRTSTSHIG